MRRSQDRSALVEFDGLVPSALPLDADNARPDLLDTLEVVLPGAFAAHGTFGHTLQRAKYRIIVPVDGRCRRRIPLCGSEGHGADR